jgi:hypothetical protein
MSQPNGKAGPKSKEQILKENPDMWPNGCIGLCCRDFVINGVTEDDPLRETLIPLYKRDGWQHFSCTAWDANSAACQLHFSGKPATCEESGFGCDMPRCHYTYFANLDNKENNVWPARPGGHGAPQPPESGSRWSDPDW